LRTGPNRSRVFLADPSRDLANSASVRPRYRLLVKARSSAFQTAKVKVCEQVGASAKPTRLGIDHHCVDGQRVSFPFHQSPSCAPQIGAIRTLQHDPFRLLGIACSAALIGQRIPCGQSSACGDMGRRADFRCVARPRRRRLVQAAQTVGKRGVLGYPRLAIPEIIGRARHDGGFSATVALLRPNGLAARYGPCSALKDDGAG